MSASITRLSLYALITAIEEDARSLFSTFAPRGGSVSSILGEQLFRKLVDRSSSDNLQDTTSNDLDEALLYADFGDAIQLLASHKKYLPEALAIQLRELDSATRDLIGIRNRVMHSRPLEFDDLAKATDLCDRLLREKQFWRSLAETKHKMSTESDYVLRIQIPFEPESSRISHNLPLPDFDETGFIGRKSTLGNLKRAILGNYPVVTIIGEGGLGKTSLALKVAFELVDSESSPFDAVVFVSAKTQKLTGNEIERIQGAIRSSVGLIEVAATALGGPSSTSVDDLVELMGQFRVLLIIDNLETILDDTIRNLLEQLPTGSKILITTRIRLGAFEFPIQLEPLSTSEANQLLRATAKTRECSRLVAMPDTKLSEFCKRMRNNPLHIKWFVAAVQSGKRPEEILADEKIFLQFCLSNVYEVISPDGRKLIRTLLSLGGSYTVAELSFLTSLDQTALMGAIGELTRTNMFFASSTPTEAGFETKYELSQLARAYLSRFYPVKKEEQQALLQHKKKLVSAGEQVQAESLRNPLSAYSIHCRTRSDWVIAKYLREALSKIKIHAYEEALEVIEAAKELAPDFSEVHRTEAYAHARAGNITSAFDCYERAIEFAPNSAVTRLLFGQFLLREAQDTEAAADQFARAVELCPSRPEPLIEYSRSLLFLRRFEEADIALKKLESMPSKDEDVERKAADIRLQFYTRRADSLMTGHDAFGALEDVAAAKRHYDRILQPDDRMQSRVSKLRLTMTQIRSALSGNADKSAQIAELFTWLDTVSALNSQRCSDQSEQKVPVPPLTGTIKNIHPTGRFGFISTEAGETIFFHMSTIRTSRTMLTPGRPVSFDLSTDWRRRVIATNVALED